MQLYRWPKRAFKFSGLEGEHFLLSASLRVVFHKAIHLILTCQASEAQRLAWWGKSGAGACFSWRLCVFASGIPQSNPSYSYMPGKRSTKTSLVRQIRGWGMLQLTSLRVVFHEAIHLILTCRASEAQRLKSTQCLMDCFVSVTSAFSA